MPIFEIEQERRKLNNQLLEVESFLANVKSDMRKMDGRKQELEQKNRVLNKKIKKLNLEIDEALKEIKKIEAEKFQLENEKKALIKKREGIISQLRELGEIENSL